MIKFRAWDKEKKIMDIVDGITFDGDEIWEISFPGDCWRDASNYELMQSTGLVDEDCVEVWEGDIIWHSENEEYGIVEFDEAKFVIRWKENYVEDLFERIDILEVIGNVHEHAHLLKRE